MLRKVQLADDAKMFDATEGSTRRACAACMLDATEGSTFLHCRMLGKVQLACSENMLGVKESSNTCTCDQIPLAMHSNKSWIAKCDEFPYLFRLCHIWVVGTPYQPNMLLYTAKRGRSALRVYSIYRILRKKHVATVNHFTPATGPSKHFREGFAFGSSHSKITTHQPGGLMLPL